MSIAKVLVVDDDASVRVSLQQVLEHNDFEVVGASGVNEVLQRISKERFDVLLSDLHMPGRGDGLTVVSAMRHANPEAVTLVFSGFPEMRAAAAAILLQADEILVKPMAIPDLIDVIRRKLANRAESTTRKTESVANILEGDGEKIILEWLTRVEDNRDLMRIPLSSQERAGHLPQVLNDLVARLRRPKSGDGDHPVSKAAHEHGRLRRLQGYSAPMIVEESRMLQVSIFHKLQNNLFRVDFSLVLVDVMTIADEVDSQLCRAMQSFTEPVRLAA
jgi:CheY-like chemotaxis protein